MAGVVFTVEGKTADGKGVRLTVSLKKFCHCKASHPNCAEDAKAFASEKLKRLLEQTENEELFWLEGQINPNFFARVMELITEVLESVCVTVRSSHLQGATLKVEVLEGAPAGG